MNAKAKIKFIVDWLDTYANKAGIKGFVIGVSGGIDSAVTSALCAMTGKDVILLNMPILQPPSQFDRSNEHIKWMKEKFPPIAAFTTDLTKTFEQISLDLPQEIQDHLTMANVRARLRMTTLYSYAGHYGYLVAGTGNKIEDFGIGFFTKYGDGGVDLSPIADLTKTEVFELAKELDIIESIQIAKPTDGLWDDDRSDEDQIGASYPELEWAMNYVDNKKQDEISTREKEVLTIYLKLNKANKHKIDPIPVCMLPK
jgi:NAD+ synthase